MRLEALKEKISQLETPQIVIGVLCCFALIVLAYGAFSSSDKQQEVFYDTALRLPEDRNRVENYQNKLEAYKRSEEASDHALTLDFKRGLFGEEIEKSTEEESPPQVKELERQIEIMEQHRTPPVRSTKSSRAVATPKSATKTDLEAWGKKTDAELSAFFSSGSSTAKAVDPKTDKDIPAYIHNNQEVRNKERVVLRLGKQATIHGKLYPRNTRIYATARFSTNRVLLNITNVQNNPARLTAYDGVDGERGVYVEGENLLGETASEGTDDLINEVDVKGVPLGSTLKDIFRKRAGARSVYLLNNHYIYLKTL